MKRWFGLFVMLLLFAAGKTQVNNYTIYVFLGENCPICQHHTLTINNLNKEYAAKGVEFVGLFPNLESDSASIDSFRKAYNISFELRGGEGRRFMKMFSATITPQVFVTGSMTTAPSLRGLPKTVLSCHSEAQRGNLLRMC